MEQLHRPTPPTCECLLRKQSLLRLHCCVAFLVSFLSFLSSLLPFCLEERSLVPEADPNVNLLQAQTGRVFSELHYLAPTPASPQSAPAEAPSFRDTAPATAPHRDTDSGRLVTPRRGLPARSGVLPRTFLRRTLRPSSNPRLILCLPRKQPDDPHAEVGKVSSKVRAK